MAVLMACQWWMDTGLMDVWVLDILMMGILRMGILWVDNLGMDILRLDILKGSRDPVHLGSLMRGFFKEVGEMDHQMGQKCIALFHMGMLIGLWT